MSADPLLATSTTSTEALMDDDTNNPPSLAKKDKGRLKKLKKRVQQQQQQTGSDMSGLLTRLDWMEYQRLETPENLRTIGPSLKMRKRDSNPTTVNKVFEGAHHRDILACFLQELLNPKANRNSKKRSRDEDILNPSLPVWATFHNPGTLEHVVVLEVHVPDLLACCTKVQSVLQDRTSYLALPTKWFQGSNNPRSISDSLLYFVSSQNTQRSELSDHPPAKKEILDELQSLTLAKDEWARAGYPNAVKEVVPCENGDAIVDSFHETIRQPDSFAIDEAKALVQRLGVRVENQKEEDTPPYVLTRSIRPDEDDSPARVFGIDCEMVQTSVGSELARITVVEFQDIVKDKVTTKTIMDALVKPYNDVKDYLTRHSGITPKLLEDVYTRLEQIQASLLTFLRPSDILIGHSLENDLRATHYIHSNIIDTALLFMPSNKRCKFSLKHLVAALLQRTIQTGSHCSEQDAVATLELAVNRAWQGDSFGIMGQDRRSLLEIIPKDSRGVCLGPAPWLRTHVTNHANGIHALSNESVSGCRNPIISYLTGSRKAQFIMSRLDVNDSKEDDSIEALCSLLVSVDDFIKFSISIHCPSTHTLVQCL
jgi:DNA polymerase III epsilon subunit-like protein